MLEEEKKRKKYWAGTLKFHFPYLVQASFGGEKNIFPYSKKGKKVGNVGSGLFSPPLMGFPPPSRDKWPHKKRNRDRLGGRGGSGLSLSYLEK